MNATSGLSSETSLTSADLQSSLENRLRVRMGAYGSPEYVLTWKKWDMELGLPICALRGSPRRISDNAFTGWPTSNALPPSRGGLQTNPEKAMERKAQGHMLNLDDVATLAGWATPTSNEPGGTAEAFLERKRKANEEGHSIGVSLTSLTFQVEGWPTPNAMTGGQSSRSGDRKGEPLMGGIVRGMETQLSGWATPTTRDHKDGSSEGTAPVNGLLGRQVWGLGESSTSLNASTAKRAALNPAHSRWLMGFPPEWDAYAPTAMPSSRSSRRSSSPRS